ncbi:MAG: PilZ domain-containing protein [Fibrobacterota bacterium]
MSTEKRTEKREHLIFYLKVYDKKNNELIGRLGDISKKGFLLISKEAFKPGEPWSISIDVSDLSVLTSKKSIEFEAQVRWSHRDINPDHFLTGFEMLSVRREDLSVIDKVVDSLRFSQ